MHASDEVLHVNGSVMSVYCLPSLFIPNSGTDRGHTLSWRYAVATLPDQRWSGVGTAHAAVGCCALRFGCRMFGGALSPAGGASLLLGLFFGLPLGLGPFVGLTGAAFRVDFLCGAILVSVYFT